jgi:hypothetical protein
MVLRRMRMNEKDMALNAFLETAKQVAPDLPDTLLKKIYGIQKQYQYSDPNDRDIPLREIEKVVLAYLEQGKK